MYTSEVTKKPIIPANNVKFTNHFPIHTMVNETLKIYSELCKIYTIHPPPIPNHVKFMLSMLISHDSLSPLANLPKFTTYTHSCTLTDFTQFTLAGKQPRLQQIQQNLP